ncbi:peptidyl-prolyl cis-trans isomerase E [Favolaschia claudopus]|uniref:Peptidyl-prolyl cis-trans isomerase E n=1 Tax=Favolaschia claudopus TaxID=2862362 RepID=A0AAW0B097_9AGAR
MDEAQKSKKTIFVGGVAEEVDEAAIYERFSTFGDIIEVQLPSSATNPTLQSEAKHRVRTADAQDAIDNMDLNEFHQRVIKVNLARPMKGLMQQSGGNRAIWESEEWLKANALPLSKKRRPEGETIEEENAHNEDAMEE